MMGGLSCAFRIQPMWLPKPFHSSEACISRARAVSRSTIDAIVPRFDSQHGPALRLAVSIGTRR